MLHSNFVRRHILKQQHSIQRAMTFLVCMTTAPLSGAASSLCPAPEPSVTSMPETKAGQVNASASTVVSSDGNSIELSGDVNLYLDSQHLAAQQVSYNRLTGDVSASGDVKYTSREFEARGESMSANLNQKTFQSGKVTYRVHLPGYELPANTPGYGNGQAAKVTHTERGVTLLEHADFTTCPAGEDPDWKLTAGSLELDHNESEGTAKHVRVAFKGVPFLYIPWFRFPVGDVRKSGFLVPRVGSSGSRGTEFQVPYYIDVAPQADATITPRSMSKRGLQLRSEWRYLSNIGQWKLDDEYLDNDSQTDTQRRFTRLRHTGNPFPDWTSYIDASDVSDAAYFDDLGGSLSIASITHLERRVEMANHTDNDVLNHSFKVRLQGYQTVDDSLAAIGKPYQRLPQLVYDATAKRRPGGFAFGLRSELVHFDRSDSVTGERFFVKPRVSKPFNSVAGFFRPSLSVWHTRFALDNTDAGNADSFERSVPVFSLDTGLFFDRATENGVQTLEPRLFYLHVPFEDQSDIPVFDAHQYDFGFAQLFRDNRFSGADRIGDARQLSVAITSRFQDRGGRELARASIGQILYFEDRRVSLSGGEVDTSKHSDLVSELSAGLNRNWSTTAGLQWDSENKSTVSGSSQLHYSDSDNTRFNIAHNYRAGDLEQVDLSFSTQLSERWRWAGRWNRSLDEDKNIEALLALEYESCCWAFRTAFRHHLIDDGEDTDNNMYFELVMKGLGNAGDDVGNQLERDILGYSDRYR